MCVRHTLCRERVSRDRKGGLCEVLEWGKVMWGWGWVGGRATGEEDRCACNCRWRIRT